MFEDHLCKNCLIQASKLNYATKNEHDCTIAYTSTERFGDNDLSSDLKHQVENSMAASESLGWLVALSGSD